MTRRADGEAHIASDSKHTKLSSNATSSQRGMVMKIEVEDAADGSKRRRIMHSNALGAIMQVRLHQLVAHQQLSSLAVVDGCSFQLAVVWMWR